MFIDDFIWLSDIVEKLLLKHNVTQDEVEELFSNKPRFRFAEKGLIPNEDVYLATGRTDSGRYLVVFFIHKPGYRALVISARDMDRSERRKHERK